MNQICQRKELDKQQIIYNHNYDSNFSFQNIPTQVIELYINHCYIKSLAGVQRLKKLRLASFKHNEISETKEIDLLSKTIESLDIRGNPIMYNKKCRYQFMVLKFPLLFQLNGKNYHKRLGQTNIQKDIDLNIKLNLMLLQTQILLKQNLCTTYPFNDQNKKNQINIKENQQVFQKNNSIIFQKSQDAFSINCDIHIQTQSDQPFQSKQIQVDNQFNQSSLQITISQEKTNFNSKQPKLKPLSICEQSYFEQRGQDLGNPIATFAQMGLQKNRFTFSEVYEKNNDRSMRLQQLEKKKILKVTVNQNLPLQKYPYLNKIKYINNLQC